MVEVHSDDTPEESAGGGGIQFDNPPDSELPPRRGSEEPDRGEAAPVRQANPLTPPAKIPLDANAVRFPLLTISRAASDLTGFDGFTFTDEESRVLSEAIAALGAQVPPAANVALLAAGMIGGKLAAYGMWRRGGRRERRQGTASTARNGHTEDNPSDEPPEGPINFTE